MGSHPHPRPATYEAGAAGHNGPARGVLVGRHTSYSFTDL